MNPENADADVKSNNSDNTEAKSTEAPKAAVTKNEDVASAFDDLFNS